MNDNVNFTRRKKEDKYVPYNSCAVQNQELNTQITHFIKISFNEGIVHTKVAILQ